MARPKAGLLSGISKMNIKDVNRTIKLYQYRLETHEKYKQMYGGDYVFHDRQIELNKRMEYYKRSIYHLKIRRNVLLRALSAEFNCRTQKKT